MQITGRADVGICSGSELLQFGPHCNDIVVGTARQKSTGDFENRWSRIQLSIHVKEIIGTAYTLQ